MAANIIMASGIVLGPSTNFFLGIIACATAFNAHKNLADDLNELKNGTKWYGQYGARN